MVEAVALETRLAMVFASGGPVEVTALCAELGVSRQTYYKWRRRFDERGLAGLEPQPRRPATSPRQTPASVEDEIVQWRKRLRDQGFDFGAQAIAYRMARAGQVAPSLATINRVLVRRGLVEPAPQKRPRSSWRRFEFGRANDCWQIDGTGWSLADGTGVCILALLDDHTRRALAARVAPVENTLDAIAAFDTASGTAGGLPERLLADNGAAFTGRFHDSVCAFERHLWQHAIRTIRARPYHPQTRGKIERWNQTLKKWLRRQPRQASPEQLQDQLDAFLILYNTDRPHSALGGATPQERWETADRGGPDPTNPPMITRVVERRVAGNGCLRLHAKQIYLGQPHVGALAHVFVTGDDIAIYIDGHLVLELSDSPATTPDPHHT